MPRFTNLGRRQEECGTGAAVMFERGWQERFSGCYLKSKANNEWGDEMPRLNEVKAYLRIDYDDDDALLMGMIKTADEYLGGVIGQNYDRQSERVWMLALMVIADLYEYRGSLPGKVSGPESSLMQEFIRQLQSESGSQA